MTQKSAMIRQFTEKKLGSPWVKPGGVEEKDGTIYGRKGCHYIWHCTTTMQREEEALPSSKVTFIVVSLDCSYSWASWPAADEVRLLQLGQPGKRVVVREEGLLLSSPSPLHVFAVHCIYSIGPLRSFSCPCLRSDWFCSELSNKHGLSP